MKSQRGVRSRNANPSRAWRPGDAHRSEAFGDSSAASFVNSRASNNRGRSCTVRTRPRTANRLTPAHHSLAIAQHHAHSPLKPRCDEVVKLSKAVKFVESTCARLRIREERPAIESP